MQTDSSLDTQVSDVADDAEWTRLYKRRAELLNWAGITYRYHRKRQRFFDWMDKLTQVAAVAGGVAVLGKSLAEYLPWVGAGISLTSLLALIYGYGDRRQSHKELAEEAISFSGKIQSTPLADLDESCLCAWEVARAAIDLREPPNLKTLVSKCEWEQATSEGHPNHVAAPRWYQQAHMHFF